MVLTKVMVTPRFVVSVIIFFAVCLIGSFSEASVSIVHKSPSVSKTLLHLTGIENDTDVCEFQVFYGSESASAYVFPHSVFKFTPQSSIPLSTQHLLIVKCTKGSFLPVFVQCGGIASGEAKQGYEGPFFLSMWLTYPQVPESSKIHVRYYVKAGTIGSIGLKVGSKGDYRFVAYENVQFIV